MLTAGGVAGVSSGGNVGAGKGWCGGGQGVDSRPMYVEILLGKKDRTEIFVDGAQTADGQDLIVCSVKGARSSGKL
jgi:hypothetical protein